MGWFVLFLLFLLVFGLCFFLLNDALITFKLYGVGDLDIERKPSHREDSTGDAKHCLGREIT